MANKSLPRTLSLPAEGWTRQVVDKTIVVRETRMPNTPHQTQPFRRPTSHAVTEAAPDPADMGTAFGLELSLESAPTPGTGAPLAAGSATTDLPPPPLCP